MKLSTIWRWNYRFNTYLFFDHCAFSSLHKKWSFPLRISSVNVTKSAVSCAVSCAVSNFNFLCSALYLFSTSIFSILLFSISEILANLIFGWKLFALKKIYVFSLILFAWINKIILASWELLCVMQIEFVMMFFYHAEIVPKLWLKFYTLIHFPPIFQFISMPPSIFWTLIYCNPLIRSTININKYVYQGITICYYSKDFRYVILEWFFWENW